MSGWVDGGDGRGDDDLSLSFSLSASLVQRFRAVISNTGTTSSRASRERDQDQERDLDLDIMPGLEQEGSGEEGDGSGSSSSDAGDAKSDSLHVSSRHPRYRPEMNIRLPLKPYLTYFDSPKPWHLDGRSPGSPRFVSLPRDTDSADHSIGPLDDFYCCTSCGTHLVRLSNLLCRSFTGRHGKASLYSEMSNIVQGPSEERSLLTGIHTVADVSCLSCKTVVGWKYIAANDKAQKYKTGKYIVEQRRIMKMASY